MALHGLNEPFLYKFKTVVFYVIKIDKTRKVIGMHIIKITAKAINPQALIEAVPAFLTKNKDKISNLVKDLIRI